MLETDVSGEVRVVVEEGKSSSETGRPWEGTLTMFGHNPGDRAT
jgi:hypothetical protein